MSTIAKPPVDVKGVSADGVGLVTGTTVAVAVLPDDEKLMAALATVAPLNVAVVAPGGILATCEFAEVPAVTVTAAFVDVPIAPLLNCWSPPGLMPLLELCD